MNIHLVCARCDRGYDLRGFNPARIVSPCPVCGFHNHVAEALTRLFGRTVGRQVHQLVNSLQRVLDKSEDNDDNSVIIERAEGKVMQIIAEAPAALPEWASGK